MSLQNKIKELDHNTLIFIQEELEDKIFVHECFMKDQKRQNNPDEILRLEGMIRAFKLIQRNIESFKDGFT